MASEAATAQPGFDAIEAVADEIATEAMAGLEGLLPPDDYAALQEIISISLAYQPELRRMTRRLAADPEVQASGDVATGEPDATPGARASGDDER